MMPALMPVPSMLSSISRTYSDAIVSGVAPQKALGTSIQIPVQQMMLTADALETSSSNLTSRPASKVVTSTRVRTPSRWACLSSATPSLMVPSLSMSSG